MTTSIEHRKRVLGHLGAEVAAHTPPKFPETSCSQCGREFGPGDSGFSHCDQHPGGVPPLEVDSCGREHSERDPLHYVLLGQVYPGKSGVIADTLNCDFALEPAEQKRWLERLASRHNCHDDMLAALKASEREYENLEDRAPVDSGCIECTLGTVPNTLNTGLCAHHLRVAAIAKAERTP